MPLDLPAAVVVRSASGPPTQFVAAGSGCVKDYIDKALVYW